MAKPAKATAEVIDAHYLAEVVHELRAPLGGVDAMADLLAKTTLTDEQQRLVQGLRAASRHLRAIADDVLDNAAQGTNAPKWQEQAFNLQEMIETIAVSADARAKTKGLTFSIETSNGLPTEITADGRSIRQMVENLIDNAIKVTAAGRISLSVTQTDRRSRFMGLRFEVRDTGPGFTSAEKDKLFRAFGRLENGIEGTGLGLALVNRMARAMGGETGCDSRAGKGATFWFTVRVKTTPASQQDVSAKQLTCQSGNAAEKPNSDLVLVVDDNQTNRQIMQVMLEHFGYRIIEAESGEQALEILQTTDVYAIMLDQTLPGLSGVETLQAIRTSGKTWAMTPVVPVTGRVSSADRKAFAHAGANGFVEKPISARSIKAALEGIVSMPEQTRKSA